MTFYSFTPESPQKLWLLFICSVHRLFTSASVHMYLVLNKYIKEGVKEVDKLVKLTYD